MSKQIQEKKRGIIFHGTVGGMEKTGFVCNTFILLVFLYDQLFGNMDMWMLIIPAVLIEIYLILFCLYTEDYCFGKTALEIRHRLKKTTFICYDSIFDIDQERQDAFLNVTGSNSVKLYYTIGKKKMFKICRLREVERFVELIKANCSVFKEESLDNTKIEEGIDQQWESLWKESE